MRRVIAVGLSGFFLTEEAFRKAVGDTLPKDWSDFAVGQSDRTRAEFIERLTFEIGRAIENIDVAEVASKLLTGRTIEVKAEFRLKPDSSLEGSNLSVKEKTEEQEK
jgi:hypothetical protein